MQNKAFLITTLILSLGATVAKSEIHYNPKKAIEYAYKHTQRGCDKDDNNYKQEFTLVLINGILVIIKVLLYMMVDMKIVLIV